MLYWTARNTSGNRWQFEDGWETPEEAERAAKFYRRDRRRRCVVVPVAKDGWGSRLAALREALSQ